VKFCGISRFNPVIAGYWVKHLSHSAVICFRSCLTAPETSYSLMLSKILFPPSPENTSSCFFRKVLFRDTVSYILSGCPDALIILIWFFIIQVFLAFLNMHSCISGKLHVFFSVASSSAVYLYTA
jgi:hypothetical protein